MFCMQHARDDLSADNASAIEGERSSAAHTTATGVEIYTGSYKRVKGRSHTVEKRKAILHRCIFNSMP